MRVSTSSVYLTSAQSLAAALERVTTQQTQVATGKAITKWSDDAPNAVSAERYRSQEADLTSFQRSATDAQGWLSAADGSLQSMSSLMTRVKELTVSATNAGLTSSSREAIATEIDQIRDEMRDLGNTSHLGRSLFGGFAAAALSSTEPVTFSGDGGAVQRQVSPTMTLTVNVSAKGVFGYDLGAGNDVFSQLSALSAAVRAKDDAGVAAAQTSLQANHSSILKALATVGTTTNRVDTAYADGSTALQALATQRSSLEDVDYASAVLQLSAAQAGYQAALGAASKANLPSLADFLK